MKKQLLAAAVAATMTSVAMADISITGGMKVNYVNTDSQTDSLDTNAINHDLDFTLVGKSGDTTVSATFATTASSSVAQVTSTSTSDASSGDDSGTATVTTTSTSTGNANGLKTENVILTTKIGDINIKTGAWAGADSLISNGSRTEGKFEASMEMNGVTVLFGDRENAPEYVKISGDVAGVSLSHEMGNTAAGNVDYTDTKVSGSVANVDVAYRAKNTDGANNDMDSLKVSTDFNGVGFTYAQAEVEGTGSGMATDDYLGELSSLHKISGFGLSTSLAGNTVQLKKVTANTGTSAAKVEDKYTKIYVTRPLASGATFEAIYTDKDAAAGSASDSKTLDLELAVKF